MIDKLDVILWDKKVGTLVSSLQKYKQQVSFYFDPDFIKTGWDIAPLRAPIHGQLAAKGLPIYPDEDRIFGGLPSFIADSLPDHWGNIVFNEWAKSRRIKQRDLSSLDRLAYIGTRGMGAFEFVPALSSGLDTPFKVEISELSKLAQTALHDAKNFHSVMSPDFLIESLFKVGTSAGGRRPKAVINVNLESGECYSGQVATPIHGFTPMIIKFDEHGEQPTTRIEYSFHLMALEAGINMMPCRLIEGENETHFLTERFDRKNEEKIHVQTLAAINPLASSYEDLFETSLRLGINHEELQQIYRQMVMNVYGGNVDDHNKNFSFTMSQDGVWHVAPAYDYTFTVDTDAPYYVNRHSMTINGKSQDINSDDLLEVARKFNIKGAQTIICKAQSVVTDYRRYAIKAGVDETWIRKIEDEIHSWLNA